MFIIVLVFIIVLITQGFLTLDEEMLIILASVLWVDAAGGFIKNALEAELVTKGSAIKDKFIWFLARKETIVNELILLHKSRISLSTKLESVFSRVILASANQTLVNFYTNVELVNSESKVSLVSDLSSGLSEVSYYNKLDNTLSILVNSGSNIIFLGKNNKYPIFGSSEQLLVKV